MRASAAIVGASALSAILLTAGLRIALSGDPEPTPLVVATAATTANTPLIENDRSSASLPVRAWVDPPPRIERAPAGEATTASLASRPAEPGTTGTLVQTAGTD